MSYCLLAYDISDDRHRSRCRRILRKIALGYQKSVFEVQINECHAIALISELSEDLESSDSFMLANVSASGYTWRLGVGPIMPTGDLMIIS